MLQCVLNFEDTMLSEINQLDKTNAISVQLLSHVQLFVTPWTVARQASLSITNSQSLLKPMSKESVMPSNHLILCHPFLLLPSIFPSIRVFSNESVLCIRWPKYWSFSIGISPSNEYSRLISFRIDWFDLLAAQGTRKSLLQVKNMEWKWKLLSCVQLFATPWTVWNSLGQNTGGSSLSLLLGIFPTQGSNPGLPHYRQILYQPSYQGSPFLSKTTVQKHQLFRAQLSL